jgi:hypothetical protein
MSRWRKRARAVINDVIATLPGADPKVVLVAIDLSYPFGPRSHHPYKMWLAERAIAKELLFGGGNAAMCACPACGAKPGKPCRSFDGVGPGFDLDEMHEARKAP